MPRSDLYVVVTVRVIGMMLCLNFLQFRLPVLLSGHRERTMLVFSWPGVPFEGVRR